MNIRGKELTPEQEKKWNEAMEQLSNELEQIPPYKKMVPQPKDGFIFNSKEANKPYDDIRKKYWTILDDILAESGVDDDSQGKK